MGKGKHHWARWRALGDWSRRYDGVGMYSDILQSLKENA